MSRVTQTFTLPPGPDPRKAVLGGCKSERWLVDTVGEYEVKLRESRGLPFLHYRAKVTVSWTGSASEGAMVTIRGRCFGFGPIQKHHLRGVVGGLRAAIEHAGL